MLEAIQDYQRARNAAEAVTCSPSSGWLQVWLCREPRKDRRNDVVGAGRCAGQRQRNFRRVALVEVGCCLGQQVKLARQPAALRVNISLKPNGCLCGSLHCLDLLVVGILDFS